MSNSKVSELRAMYGPPPVGSKPTPASSKPVGGRWNANAASNENSNPPASVATKNSFLHAGGAGQRNNWQANSGNNSAGPKKPWEQNTASSQNDTVNPPKKPWERSTGSGVNSTATPRKPWEQSKPENASDNKPWMANNEIKKTPSFSSNRDKPAVLGKSGISQSFSSADNNIPAWKRNLNANKTDSTSTDSANSSGDNVPAWKRNLNANKGNSALSDATNSSNDNIPSWKRNLQADKPDFSPAPANSIGSRMNYNKPAEPSTKPSWTANQAKNDEEPKNESNFNPMPSRKPSFLDKAKASNNMSGQNSQSNDQRTNRNFAARNMLESNRPGDNPEKNNFNPTSAFSTQNRFGTAKQTPPPPPSQKPAAEAPSSGGGVSRGPSFLQRPQNPAAVNTTAQERRKRQLPPDVYHRPAPVKPRKPPHARLPGEKGSDLPPTPPPSNFSDPSGPRRNASSFISKQHSPNRGGNASPLTSKPLPTAPSAKPSPPVPSSLMPPGGDDGFPRPPSPNKLRNLPPPPNAPDDDAGDIYDDTSDVPPPLPNMSMHPSASPLTDSFAEIPTWDDEDDQEQLYDEAPGGGSPPPIPEEEEGDEMYEDLDQYSKFKGIQNRGSNAAPAVPASPSALPSSDKIKIDKKEKAARKKFLLPTEGEIISEAVGFIRADVKGFNKMTLHANERVDVIRMNNNPKGKWLIRSENGAYGYADPDNINTDPYAQRRQQQFPQPQFGAPNLPPSLPGNMPGAPPPLPGKMPGAPPPLPGGKPGAIPEDDGEAIYDETPEPDEELYEEL